MAPRIFRRTWTVFFPLLAPAIMKIINFRVCLLLQNILITSIQAKPGIFNKKKDYKHLYKLDGDFFWGPIP